MADKINSYENQEKSPTTTIAICWNSSPFSDGLQRRIQSFNNKGRFNPFNQFLNRNRLFKRGMLCYSDFLSGLHVYYKNALSTAKVGELLAKIVTAIQQEFPNIKYVHGIGHSLGAHVMGNIFNFGGVKLNR